MSGFFSRSLRALKADGCRRSILSLLFAFCVLCCWAAWFLLARVTLYEVSGAALVELDRVACSLDAPVRGRIVANHMVLGREVLAGDMLVEFDTATERLMVEEEKANIAALTRQIEALSHELKAQNQAHYEYQQMTRRAIDEARANYRQAEVDFVLMEDDLKRSEALHAVGIVPEAELFRARAEVQKHREAADALSLRIHQMEWEEKNHTSENRVRLEQIRREMAMMQGEIAAKSLAVERLTCEIDKSYIRAPVAGRIDGIKDVRVGSVVQEGERLGTILPPGKLRIAADFSPSVAVGRIIPGQRAQLRLDSFPWTQYGSIPATVATVAREVRDGHIRAELAINTHAAPPITLQHGLSGSVEVEVERVTPKDLILRAVGKLLTRPSGFSGSPSGPGLAASTVPGGHDDSR
ncbi:MAG: HlyD family efflux transporter periplasmic adaptor subunit [bacterium]